MSEGSAKEVQQRQQLEGGVRSILCNSKRIIVRKWPTYLEWVILLVAWWNCEAKRPTIPTKWGSCRISRTKVAPIIPTNYAVVEFLMHRPTASVRNVSGLDFCFHRLLSKKVVASKLGFQRQAVVTAAVCVAHLGRQYFDSSGDGNGVKSARIHCTGKHRSHESRL